MPFPKWHECGVPIAIRPSIRVRIVSPRRVANGVSRRKTRNGIATKARSCCMAAQTPQRSPCVSSPLSQGNTIAKKQFRCDIHKAAHLQEPRVTAGKRTIAQELLSAVASKLSHTAPNPANTLACNISDVAQSREPRKRVPMQHHAVAQLPQRPANARKQPPCDKPAPAEIAFLEPQVTATSP